MSEQKSFIEYSKMKIIRVIKKPSLLTTHAIIYFVMLFWMKYEDVQSWLMIAFAIGYIVSFLIIDLPRSYLRYKRHLRNKR